jgi:hypothetical protein
MRYINRVLPLLLLAVVSVPSTSLAGRDNLWNGLVSFNRPAKTVLEATTLDGWDKAYVVKPRRTKGAPRAGAVIVRETLATSEANLSTAELAELLKQRFLEDDLRVGQWKFNKKKQQVTGSLSGKAEVPWSGGVEQAAGTFRVIRVFKNEVVGVLAFGAPKEFRKPSAKPFRQLVSTFRTPKPKPNKARR